MTALLSILAALSLVIPGCDDSHTNAPPGSLVGPWLCVGYWQGCTGTAISPHHFISATHVGGCVGDTFYIPRADGTFETFLVMNGWHDPFSDLSVWLILGEFRSWANLNGETRLGSATNALIVGNGMSRGAPYYAETWTTNYVSMAGTRVETALPASRMTGYEWSWPRGQMRWGVNPLAEAPGNQLMLPFSTCGLANGDSGGPVFIERGGKWLLAGINLAVSGQGPYSTYPNQEVDMPCCYWNFADLYSRNFRWPNNGVYTTTGWATAIAPRINWILGILDL